MLEGVISLKRVGVQIHIFLTSVLIGAEWSASRSGRFIPGRKSPKHPLDRRLRGPQNRSGQRGEEKILDPTGTLTLIPWSSSQ
jgi:hypothetical protein